MALPIHMTLPGVPPSMNQMYVRTRGGKRALSTAGRKYKTEAKTHLTRNYPEALRAFEKNKPLLLVLHFTFEKDLLLNKGYPDTSENRYKKFDVTNRVKIVEDAITEATGIDDSHHWTVLLRKAVGETASTHIWMQHIEDGQPNAITNYLDTLLSMGEDE